MTDKKREERQIEKEGAKVDFGPSGHFSFGGIFQNIDNLDDWASQLSEGEGEIREQGQIKIGKDVKGVGRIENVMEMEIESKRYK